MQESRVSESVLSYPSLHSHEYDPGSSWQTVEARLHLCRKLLSLVEHSSISKTSQNMYVYSSNILMVSYTVASVGFVVEHESEVALTLVRAFRIDTVRVGLALGLSVRTFVDVFAIRPVTLVTALTSARVRAEVV